MLVEHLLCVRDPSLLHASLTSAHQQEPLQNLDLNAALLVFLLQNNQPVGWNIIIIISPLPHFIFFYFIFSPLPHFKEVLEHTPNLGPFYSQQ